MLILSVVWLGVAGCATVRGTSLMDVDHTSPEQLAISFHQAIEARDFGAVLECYAPEWQDELDPLLVQASRVWARVPSLRSQIEERIGKDEAEQFVQNARNNCLVSPFAQLEAESAPDWSRLRWLVRNDTAIASTTEQPLFKAKKIGSSWYVVPEMSESAFRSSIQMGTAFFRGAADAMGTFSRQISQGRINKGNFRERLLGLDEEDAERDRRWAAIPYGDPVDGVQIRIVTVTPYFRRGERLDFYIHAKREADRPVGWLAPCTYSGLGENVSVYVDGSPVPTPDHRGLEFYGESLEGWTIRLPESVANSVGSHTIRYELVSPGGTYTDEAGKAHRLLKGTLVSNELSFEVRE